MCEAKVAQNNSKLMFQFYSYFGEISKMRELGLKNLYFGFFID